MRLYIDNHYFISVIPQEEKGFNCQIMNLVHGIGMYPASITDNQKDVVSCIVHGVFKKESVICKDLSELFEYHGQCVAEITEKFM